MSLNVNTARYTQMDCEESYLHELYLTKMYNDKAFHILRIWLDHNIKKWRD